MGNRTSKSSTTRPMPGHRHQNRAPASFNFLEFPPEIQTMIASHLCASCSTGGGEIASTEEARALQRDLGNLARCSSHLLTVANTHRFHSFVMARDPAFHRRRFWHGNSNHDGDFALAHLYNNRAFPELLQRLLNYGQLRENLRFLSLRNFTLRAKAGITKRRLRLLINASHSLGLPVPGFIPVLLSLPDHTTSQPPSLEEQSYWLEGELWLEDVRPALNCTHFDTWLVRLLLFKLAPNLEKLTMDPEVAARAFELNAPAANLPLVSTLGISESTANSIFANLPPAIGMETFFLSFPNLYAFQNNERSLGWDPDTEIEIDDDSTDISDGSPPLGPNLRRLVLASEQPRHLHHVTQVLREFPRLEWFYFHRKRSVFWGPIVEDFSNANVFDAVHHSLRVLKYTSTLVSWHPEMACIEITSYEEAHFSDVPHFGAFRVLERLEIDQALLGRMSTFRDYVGSPIGPQFPELNWKLPESLRTLTIRFVHDFPTLAAQLVPLAVAKRAGGQIPLLEKIFVVITQTITVSYDGTWPPQIPLPAGQNGIIVATGMLLREAGINLFVSTEDIGPRPVELDDHPNDGETRIPIIYRLCEFPAF